MSHPLRSLETFLMSAIGIAVMWAGSSACGFDPTSPQVDTGCSVAASNLTCPGLIVTVTTDAPMTITVGGVPTTVSSFAPIPLVGIDTGLVQIAGTAAGAHFSVSLTTRATSTAGAISGTLVNIAGPATTIGACQIAYVAPPAASPAPWGFSFRLSPTGTRC